jgi:hypothetical protein
MSRADRSDDRVSMENVRVKAIALLMLSGCSLYFGDPSGTAPSPAADASPAIAKRVFVTSTRYQGGALGGLAGADAKCNERAAAAGLSGNFEAWLSDATMSAAARMTHAGPYTLVDGTLVARSWNKLVSGWLERSIDRDETNVPYDSTVPFYHPSWSYNESLGAKETWTGTMHDGTTYDRASDSSECGGYPDCACFGWNDVTGLSLAGDAISTTVNWSEGGGLRSCADLGALYCIEQ